MLVRHKPDVLVSPAKKELRKINVLEYIIVDTGQISLIKTGSTKSFSIYIYHCRSM